MKTTNSRGPLGSRHPWARGCEVACASPGAGCRSRSAASGCWTGCCSFRATCTPTRSSAEVIEPTATGQPGFISDPILTLAHFYGHDLTLWNTLAAEIQCAIGLGLILSRRTVRPALLVSFAWAFVVWWFGEGFGTILSGAPVSPLMGAPGAVLVYGLIGLLVWPIPG